MRITLQERTIHALKAAMAVEVLAQEPKVMTRAHVRQLGPDAYEADLTFVDEDPA